jgi:hypothetical protein
MPPMESDLLESDFDAAVSFYVYLFESRRDAERMNAAARATALELARTLAPLFGGKVADEGDNEDW